MDPFEARLQFIKTLNRLNASSQAIENVLDFIARNPALDEDLHACILQELKNCGINSRLNILFLVQELVSSSYDPESFLYTRRHILRDLSQEFPSIVSEVVPEGSQGFVNLRPCKELVDRCGPKLLNKEEILPVVEAYLNARFEDEKQFLESVSYSKSAKGSENQASQGTNEGTNDQEDTLPNDLDNEKNPEKQINTDSERPQKSQNTKVPEVGSPVAPSTGPSAPFSVPPSVPPSGPTNGSANGPPANTASVVFASSSGKRDDILRRMDEDRERHKRLKETIWEVDSTQDPFAELNMALANPRARRITGLDYAAMSEENKIFERATGIKPL